MKVALVHDWLTGMRGGERCLEAFCELFPDADLFTLLHLPGSVAPVNSHSRSPRFARHPATLTTAPVLSSPGPVRLTI